MFINQQLSLSDNSDIVSDVYRKFSVVDEEMRLQELSSSQIRAIQNLPVSLGMVGSTGNSRVTFGAARDHFSAWIGRIIAAPDSVPSSLGRYDAETLSKIHELFFPNPYGRLESFGPFELLNFTLRFDRPWVLTPELLGKFFGALLFDQKQFDESSAVLLGEDRGILFNQNRSNAIIGEVEEKLAELVMSHSGSSLDDHGLDLETEKLFIANYMKNRVVPMWFAHHKEELAGVLGLGASECNFTYS